MRHLTARSVADCWKRTKGRWGLLDSETRIGGNDMEEKMQLTALIQREEDAYVALCPELDIASQGDTVEEARENLIEAVELFLEDADPSEIERRLRTEVYVTRLEVAVG